MYWYTFGHKKKNACLLLDYLIKTFNVICIYFLSSNCIVCITTQTCTVGPVCFSQHTHLQTWCRCSEYYSSVARKANESTLTPQAVPSLSFNTTPPPQPDSQASVSGCSLHPPTLGSVWHPHAGPKSVPREHAGASLPRHALFWHLSVTLTIFSHRMCQMLKG